nr:hypothetical protein GCM10020093_020960 [Planobispora longispora]
MSVKPDHPQAGSSFQAGGARAQCLGRPSWQGRFLTLCRDPPQEAPPIVAPGDSPLAPTLPHHLKRPSGNAEMPRRRNVIHRGGVMNDSISANDHPEQTTQESEVLTEDMLLEDVSIDGMCGVY